MNRILNLEKLIGHTPMISIKYRYENQIKHVYCKCEWFSLTGSIKDRVALSILKNAYMDGSLSPNQPIVETTSGNMGISFSAIGKYLGHDVIIFMPSQMSRERKELIKLYGATLYECDSFEECFSRAKEYATKHNAYLTLQFDNPYNTLAHYSTTAMEIVEKIPTPTCFVAGVGTSGTLMGVGSHLKELSSTKIIAIEPKSSLILSSGRSQGEHKIQGLSDDIIPSIYNSGMVDNIISISDEDAIAMARKLSNTLGLGVGISSGANFAGAVLSNIDNAVTIFTDDSKKYITTELVLDTKSNLVDSIDLIDFEVI